MYEYYSCFSLSIISESFTHSELPDIAYLQLDQSTSAVMSRALLFFHSSSRTRIRLLEVDEFWRWHKRNNARKNIYSPGDSCHQSPFLVKFEVCCILVLVSTVTYQVLCRIYVYKVQIEFRQLKCSEILVLIPKNEDKLNLPLFWVCQLLLPLVCTNHRPVVR